MEWIKFNLEKPKTNIKVLVKTKKGKYVISEFNGIKWKGSKSFSDSIEFWRYFPEYDNTWYDKSIFPELNKEVLLLTSNNTYAISMLYKANDCYNNIIGIRWKGSSTFIDSIKFWKYLE